MKRHLVLGAVVRVGLAVYASDLFAEDKQASKAFDTVQKVVQSPRCQNGPIQALGRGWRAMSGGR